MIVLGCSLVVCAHGCDFIYRLVHKEGAQEKHILGDVPPGVFNPVVEEIQKLLQLYGYNSGRADGKLGTRTRDAIEAFQADRGLTPNRFVDTKTWQLLSQFGACGLVIAGEVEARAVQVALYTAGFDPGKINGKIGPRTTQAIREFQRAHTLAVDGKVGYNTLSALKRYLPEK